jgi:hypothetical protein
MNTTFEGFVAAVKQQYEVSKNGMYSGFLLNPSPAQLRNLCLLLLENKLSKIDEEIFRVFFQVAEGAVLKKAVENFDVEKFRAVGNFLKGRSEKTNAVSLNLISVLVDFQPRPFNKYLKTNVHSDVAVVSKEKEHFQEIATFFYGSSNDNEGKIVKSNSMKQFSIMAITAVLFLAAFYTINQAFFREKECMQWQKDHYEKVDCKSANQGMATFNEVKPVNEREMNLKKVEVNKGTLFFKNGKPQIWYSKIKGKMYYFDANGDNPETGRPLKPITEYMIKKYVLK